MEALDLVILIILPILLFLSAFFSGSETALFAMTETERMHLRQRGGIAGRAVDALLSNPRMLLITVLLGNMVVNVGYFVISSVLLMRIHPGAIGGTVLALATLLAIVLFGEVLPKMTANAHRERFASIIGPPMLALHNIITPLRIVLDRVVVAPLSRLTAPADGPPPRLSEDELAELLELSGEQGVIDEEEQRILREVVSMSRLRVRDIMTPRVHMAGVPVDAAREDVLRIVREAKRNRLPVYESDLDSVLGILPVKLFLLQSPQSVMDVRSMLAKPQYIPHVATLDQLLEHFRKTGTRSAIAVDEFGGTAGIVSIEDVIERFLTEDDDSPLAASLRDAGEQDEGEGHP